jgi:hypothetical protein
MLIKLEFPKQIFERKKKFKRQISSKFVQWGWVVPCERTDMTTVLVAFRYFSNAPKNDKVSFIPLSKVSLSLYRYPRNLQLLNDIICYTFLYWISRGEGVTNFILEVWRHRPSHIAMQKYTNCEPLCYRQSEIRHCKRIWEYENHSPHPPAPPRFRYY